LSEVTVKIDEKGRIVLPANIRRELGIKNIVKIKVEKSAITIEPVEDPLRFLEGLTVKGTKDVEKEIRKLRRTAYRELLKVS
jgi:AbrB family looped-hinge helix DNA binding protein